MSADNAPPANSAQQRPVSLATARIVYSAVTANSATQFAIQAWMSYGFARDVWRAPTPLCVAVIVALDLFVVVFMIFTYLLRTARFRTRAFVWLVLLAGIGAQLYAAEMFAVHEKWPVAVEIFAALPALFLAASLHGLIIWRAHLANPPEARPAIPEVVRRRAGVDSAPSLVEVRHIKVPPGPAPGAAVPPSTPPPPGRARRQTAMGERPADVVKVRELVAAGVPCASAGPQVGHSKRWAEMHTRDIRDARSVKPEPLAAGGVDLVQDAGRASRPVQGALPKENSPSQDRLHG